MELAFVIDGKPARHDLFGIYFTDPVSIESASGFVAHVYNECLKGKGINEQIAARGPFTREINKPIELYGRPHTTTRTMEIVAAPYLDRPLVTVFGLPGTEHRRTYGVCIKPSEKDPDRRMLAEIDLKTALANYIGKKVELTLK